MSLTPVSLRAPESALRPSVSLARCVGLRARLLVPLLTGALLACGSDAAAPSRSDESPDEETTDQPNDTDTDDVSTTDASGGKAPGKVDAASKPLPDEPKPKDAGNGPGQSADAGGSSPKGDSGVESEDGGKASIEPDAGTSGEPTEPSGSGDTTISMTIPTPSNGVGEVRPSTTVLKGSKSGGKDVWDFENKKIGVNNTVECDGDQEGQLTVFEVEDGVTVKNLIIAGGKPGGNGIVCKGSCTLDHVYWEDVCEDAATNSKDGATMTLDHVIALHATDKMFQHNAKGGSKTVIRNSYIADFGKLWRSCGDCEGNGGPRNLEIDNVRVEGIKTTVAGANRNYKDTVTVKNLYVKGGYDASKDKPKICQEYNAVTNHQGESTKIDDGKSQWNTATCKLSLSDVKSY
jgi:hypothetical protein